MSKTNKGSTPSYSSSQRFGKDVKHVISFELINVYEIHLHDDFVELENRIGILESMIVGVFSVFET